MSVGAASIAGPLPSVASAQGAAGPYPDPISCSWIRGSSSIRTTPRRSTSAKPTCGQGTGTAFRQMMADELDIALRQDQPASWAVTDLTVDQGGSGGSDAIQTDGWPMRRGRGRGPARAARDGGHAIRCARRSTSPSTAGVIAVKADPSKKITYGELIGGKRFNVTLTGNNIDATTGRGEGQAGSGSQNRRRTSPQRYDIPAKVDGSLKWAVDVKLPGMVHARNVKPPVAGRQADQHRRVLRARHPRVHQGREQGQLRRRRLRAGRAGHRGRQTAQGELAEAGDTAVPDLGRSLHATCAARRRPRSRRPVVQGDPRRGAGRRTPRSSRPNTTSRSRGTPRSRRLTRWPIRRTAR